VATEDVLYMLHGLGIETGVDLEQVVDAGQFISRHLGRKGASRAGNAIAAKRLG
jgi:hydroxymethylglutaryl-CoA lyase